LLVVLVASLIVAAVLPAVAFAGGPNGKGKGHGKPVAVAEPKENGKLANPGNGNPEKGNDGPKPTGPTGGNNPAPTPTPTPTPTKQGAQVVKNTKTRSGSGWSACVEHHWEYTSQLMEVIPRGAVVTYRYKVDSAYWGYDYCASVEAYRGSSSMRIQVVWEKATNTYRVYHGSYEFDDTWYGVRHTYKALYDLGPYNQPALKLLWVDRVKVPIS
jgi:hypothetical protein